MAITNTVSNFFKSAVLKKEVDGEADLFKIALMGTGFSLDMENHSNWADVSGEEIAGGNGYTSGGQYLPSGEVIQNNTLNTSKIMFSGEVNFTADGGAFPDVVGAVIYNDSHVDKLIAGYSDFGTTVSTDDGMGIRIKNPSIVLS